MNILGTDTDLTPTGGICCNHHVSILSDIVGVVKDFEVIEVSTRANLGSDPSQSLVTVMKVLLEATTKVDLVSVHAVTIP